MRLGEVDDRLQGMGGERDSGGRLHQPLDVAPGRLAVEEDVDRQRAVGARRQRRQLGTSKTIPRAS